MKILSFIKKHWKIYLILLIVLVGIILGLYILKDKNKEENSHNGEQVLLFSVTDVSKKCFSNGLKVYSNNKYEIIKSAVPEGENNLLKTGTYNYDIDKLLASFNDDTCDMENYFNYRVTLESGESYCIIF